LGLLVFLLVFFSLAPIFLLPLEVIDQVFIVLLDSVEALVQLCERVRALESHRPTSLLLFLLVHVEGRPDLVGVTVPDAVVIFLLWL